jgi:hypothetical protein
VGNCAGFTLGKFLPIIKKSIPPLKLKRYQFISLNLCVLLFGWYGYKIASYERKIGRTNIVKDALNIEDVEVRIVE